MRIRPERVAQRIQREVADIVGNRLRDPQVSQWVGVTDVEVNPDLTLARIFVSVLSEGEEQRRTLDALERATPFVRRELAGRLGLREVPEIRFLLDTSIERGARVEELLRRIERGDPPVDEEES
jgi:ribosome-binding factor A